MNITRSAAEVLQMIPDKIRELAAEMTGEPVGNFNVMEACAVILSAIDKRYAPEEADALAEALRPVVAGQHYPFPPTVDVVRLMRTGRPEMIRMLYQFVALRSALTNAAQFIANDPTETDANKKEGAEALRYFVEEIDETAGMLNDPENAGEEIQQILNIYRTNGAQAEEAANVGALAQRIMRGVMQRISAQPEAFDEGTATDPAEPIRATARRADKIDFPLDKLSRTLFSLTKEDINEMEEAGSILHVDGRRRSDKRKMRISKAEDIETQAFLSFGDLEGVTIQRKLTAFDESVYIACGALYELGPVTSLTQIYYAMGGRGYPNGKQLEKINESIIKMLLTYIEVDNRKEAAKYKYPVYIYDGALLPWRRVRAYINGALTEEAIQFLVKPPLMDYAKNRNQITTVKTDVLQVPLSATDENLAIRNYLVRRVKRAKSGNMSNRILYETICKEALITDRKQKTRVKDKVRRMLDYFKTDAAGHFIKRYTEEKDGVTIYF